MTAVSLQSKGVRWRRLRQRDPQPGPVVHHRVVLPSLAVDGAGPVTRAASAPTRSECPDGEIVFTETRGRQIATGVILTANYVLIKESIAYGGR